MFARSSAKQSLCFRNSYELCQHMKYFTVQMVDPPGLMCRLSPWLRLRFEALSLIALTLKVA